MLARFWIHLWSQKRLAEKAPSRLFDRDFEFTFVLFLQNYSLFERSNPRDLWSTYLLINESYNSVSQPCVSIDDDATYWGIGLTVALDNSKILSRFVADTNIFKISFHVIWADALNTPWNEFTVSLKDLQN